MIGGTDIIIVVRDSESAIDLALRATRRLWPTAVYENADTGEAFAAYRPIVLSSHCEILVYRDEAARNAWDELGADESLDGTMIHLIARECELTIAVDDVPNSTISAYIETVRKGLRQDIFLSIDDGQRRAA